MSKPIDKKYTSNKTPVEILSLEAKDIYMAMLDSPSTGFLPRYNYGKHEYNLKLFKNKFDYSIDLIKLREIYYKKYRNKRFSFKNGDHEYSLFVINVTFKYSLNEFNKATKDTFVKLGYRYSNIKSGINDCLAFDEDGDVICVETNKTVISPCDSLPECFKYNEEKRVYETKGIKTVMSTSELRQYLYTNGFRCDGYDFVCFKRSSGSARVGKVLFLEKSLYEPFHKWEDMGLNIAYGQEVDLAGYEAYIALTTSSIIDVMNIKPYNILLVDDYDSVFNDNVVDTYLNENNELYTEEKTIEISNSIFDGESLMDTSLFGEYNNKGMLLLRNQFFKSCCFNANIQLWFKEHGITSVSQLNGRTRAKKIEDVLLITTPNSIKYLKFGTFDKWLDNISETFGIVKYEKKTHFFDGKFVQTHYQLLNTLRIPKSETKRLLQPSFDFLDKVKNDPDVLRFYIKYPYGVFEHKRNISDKNEIFYKMVGTNYNFRKTKIYKDFLSDTVKAFIKNMRKGHILVEGNYSTICGNPIELLQQSIGEFHGESVIGKGNVVSKRFPYEDDLLLCRSPHVTSGCVCVRKNTKNELIDRYMNGTDEILYINSIDENILMQLAGCDFDSDTVLLTNDPILLKYAKQSESMFKVPTNSIPSTKIKRRYTLDERCDLDIKTSSNQIGSIINLSQELNTLFWHKLNNGYSYDDIKGIYYDACQLSNMSATEIDRAKKEFSFSNKEELDKMREKYQSEEYKRTDNEGRKIKPYFFSFIQKYKGYYDSKRNNYMKHDTTMDYLEEEINRYSRKRTNRNDDKTIKFVECLKSIDFPSDEKINYHAVQDVRNMVDKYMKDVANIFTDTDMNEDKKHELYKETKERYCDYIHNKKMNKKTMYYILSLFDTNTNKKLYNALFPILFAYNNSSFYDLIEDSREEIKELVQDDSGDIDIYGVKYAKIPVIRKF